MLFSAKDVDYRDHKVRIVKFEEFDPYVWNKLAGCKFYNLMDLDYFTKRDPERTKYVEKLVIDQVNHALSLCTFRSSEKTDREITILSSYLAQNALIANDQTFEGSGEIAEQLVHVIMADHVTDMFVESEFGNLLKVSASYHLYKRLLTVDKNRDTSDDSYLLLHNVLTAAIALKFVAPIISALSCALFKAHDGDTEEVANRRAQRSHKLCGDYMKDVVRKACGNNYVVFELTKQIHQSIMKMIDLGGNVTETLQGLIVDKELFSLDNHQISIEDLEEEPFVQYAIHAAMNGLIFTDLCHTDSNISHLAASATTGALSDLTGITKHVASKVVKDEDMPVNEERHKVDLIK